MKWLFIVFFESEVSCIEEMQEIFLYLTEDYVVQQEMFYIF